MIFYVKLDRLIYRRLILISHLLVFFLLGMSSAIIFFTLFPQPQSEVLSIFFLLYLILVALVSGELVGRVKMSIAQDRLVFRGLLPFQRFEVNFLDIKKAWPGDPLSSMHNFIAMLRRKRTFEDGKPNSNMIALDIRGKQNDPLEIKLSNVKIAHELILELEARGLPIADKQFE